FGGAAPTLVSFSRVDSRDTNGVSLTFFAFLVGDGLSSKFNFFTTVDFSPDLLCVKILLIALTVSGDQFTVPDFTNECKTVESPSCSSVSKSTLIDSSNFLCVGV